MAVRSHHDIRRCEVHLLNNVPWVHDQGVYLREDPNPTVDRPSDWCDDFRYEKVRVVDIHGRESTRTQVRVIPSDPTRKRLLRAADGFLGRNPRRTRREPWERIPREPTHHDSIEVDVVFTKTMYRKDGTPFTIKRVVKRRIPWTKVLPRRFDPDRDSSWYTPEHYRRVSDPRHIHG